MPKGKLIIIESGTDASGKATQTDLLYEAVSSQVRHVRKITYPNYESTSSALVKMYLAGEFGTDPFDVNAYAASIFFAIDRYASYHSGWKEFYEQGGIVLADRYTTSNMIHQSVKLDKSRQDSYISWLIDLEYGKLELPRPDCVIFLDVNPDISEKLMEKRANKITGAAQKDIHESDKEYLKKAYLNSLDIAKRFGWIKINCCDKNEMRSVEDIHREVFGTISKIVGV
jgi:dTMP kinase